MRTGNVGKRGLMARTGGRLDWRVIDAKGRPCLSHLSIEDLKLWSRIRVLPIPLLLVV